MLQVGCVPFASVQVGLGLELVGLIARCKARCPTSCLIKQHRLEMAVLKYS